MVICCRVVHSDSVLRLGIQGLTAPGAVGVFGCVSGSNTATLCHASLMGMREHSVGGRYVWQVEYRWEW